MSDKIVILHGPCPVCSSSDAYCEWEDGHGHCFSCNTHFPKKGVNLEDFTYQFYAHRGISVNTFRFYDAKTKIDKDGKPVAIGFVYPSGDCQVRSLIDKDFYWAKTGEKSKTGLFGRDKFAAGSHKAVTITEGAYDALSLYEVLHTPVVSVQSAGSAWRDVSGDRSWLNSFEKVYLAFDGDEPGRNATREVAKLFDPDKVYDLRFTNRKDANEYLVAGERDTLINLWHNAKRYKPEEIDSTFDEFDKILSEEPPKSIPYPFPTLNTMLYGLRKKEIVLITALEGVGKTEILRTIEHKLLKETDENVGAIFLEEPKRRHLEGLAGIELRTPAHLPGCTLTKDQKLSALHSVVGRDDRLLVCSYPGSGDPDVLLDTIRFLAASRSCGFIILDHIGLGVNGLLGEDERRALDYLSAKLAAMVQELNFGLLIVSHINDFGQTRGSRAIAQYAHVRITAKRDIEHEDPAERLVTYLRITKNRPCSMTGPAGRLIFDPVTYTLSEEGEADKNFLPANDNIQQTEQAA